MAGVPLLFLIFIVVIYLISSIKILAEYERGVIFRLGRLLPQAKGPGVILVFAPIDRMVRISLRVDTIEVPPQDVITRDNVTVKVNAVIYFRVVEPRLAVTEVSNFLYASSQLAQTTLRSVLGEVELDDLLSKRDELNVRLQSDSRRAHVSMGRQSHTGLRQAGGSPGTDDPRHRAAGGSGAREARQDHSRRRRVYRVGKTGYGRGGHSETTRRHTAALSTDACRDRDGEKYHDRVPAAHRHFKRAWTLPWRQLFI